MTGLTNLITELHERYQSEVKPLIESEDYFEAMGAMNPIMAKLEEHEDELGTIRSGHNYYANANVIFKRLQKDKKPSKALMKILDVCGAQAQLPLE